MILFWPMFSNSSSSKEMFLTCLVFTGNVLWFLGVFSWWICCGDTSGLSGSTFWRAFGSRFGLTLVIKLFWAWAPRLLLNDRGLPVEAMLLPPKSDLWVKRSLTPTWDCVQETQENNNASGPGLPGLFFSLLVCFIRSKTGSSLETRACARVWERERWVWVIESVCNVIWFGALACHMCFFFLGRSTNDVKSGSVHGDIRFLRSWKQCLLYKVRCVQVAKKWQTNGLPCWLSLLGSCTWFCCRSVLLQNMLLCGSISRISSLITCAWCDGSRAPRTRRRRLCWVDVMALLNDTQMEDLSHCVWLVNPTPWPYHRLLGRQLPTVTCCSRNVNHLRRLLMPWWWKEALFLRWRPFFVRDDSILGWNDSSGFLCSFVSGGMNSLCLHQEKNLWSLCLWQGWWCWRQRSKWGQCSVVVCILIVLLLTSTLRTNFSGLPLTTFTTSTSKKNKNQQLPCLFRHLNAT